MTDSHEPSGQFVSHLEWQLRTAMSRRDRFSRPTSPLGSRALRLAALILISAFLGGAGVTGSKMVEDSRARDYFLSRIDLQLELAEAQQELMRGRADQVAEQYENLLVGQDALAVARQSLKAAETEYARLTLDREEIVLRGQEPLQSLSAPLVNGRDFVTARLDLQISLVEDQVRLTTARAARAAALVEEGLVNAREAQQHALALESQKQYLEMLLHHRSLRERFLREELSVAEVERAAMATEASCQLEYQSLSIEAARQHLERVRELHQHGMIHEAELRAAELGLLEHELELQRLQLRVTQLEPAREPLPER